MRSFLKLVLLFVSSNVCFSQGIVFQNRDLNSSKALAQEENKLLFVDLFATWCGPCLAMDKNVFSKKEVGDVFNSAFVNVRLDIDSPEGKDLVKKAMVSEYPTYLFLDVKENVVHRLAGYQPTLRLLKEARTAQKLAESFENLGVLEEKYSNGSRDPEFLEQYLLTKQKQSGPQPILLDVYLEHLPKGELKTQKVLNTIEQNIASVNSLAFKLLAISLENFFAFTEEQQRTVLNAISKAKLASFKKAVVDKDDTLLQDVLDATMATSYSRETAMEEERQFRYEYALLTQNFKHFAVIAYDEAARILEMTEAEYHAMDNELQKQILLRAEDAGISFTDERVQKELKRINSKRNAAKQLNEFAMGFWEMTNQKAELQNALKWSAAALKLHEAPSLWETYSLLLEKLGRQKDASKAMKYAAKLSKKRIKEPLY